MTFFARERRVAVAIVLTCAALAGCDVAADGTGDPPHYGDDASAAPDASDAGSKPGRDGGRDASSSPDAADASTTDASDATIDAPIDTGLPDTNPPDTGPLDTDGDGVADVNDCAPTDAGAWQLLPYSYRDADGDGFTVVASGSVCSGASLPSGYATMPSGDDCNDADPAVHALLPYYPDGDGDGVGAGSPQTACAASPPPGYSAVGTDCAPADASRWQALAYSFVDADGDGYTVASSGSVCSGAALPAGYATTANGDDCDDTNPKVFAAVTVYADTDGDGVGAGPGTPACTNGSATPGTSLTDTDCAPTDPTQWQTLGYSYVDRDGDGFTTFERGSVCSGASLAPPYFTTAKGNDCDDTSKDLTHWDVLWPDKDADGAGAGAYVFSCDGTAIPAGLSRYGDDEDDANASVGPLAPEDILDLVLF